MQNFTIPQDRQLHTISIIRQTDETIHIRHRKTLKVMWLHFNVYILFTRLFFRMIKYGNLLAIVQ